MGTPKRTSILTSLQTLLEGITVANGYNTTVDTVEPWLRSRDDVKSGELPYIGFGLGPESYRHESFGSFIATCPLVILGYVADPDWATRSVKINALVDDIIARLNTDPTHNGNAIDTYPIRLETDEVDPDAEEAGVGSLVFEYEIKYHRGSTAS